MTTDFASEQAAFFRVLSDATRQRMLALLRRPITIPALADALDVPVHNLYHHMRVLEEAGMVERVPGEETTYRVIPAALWDAARCPAEYVPWVNRHALELAESHLDRMRAAGRGPGRVQPHRVSVRTDASERVAEIVRDHWKTLVAALAAVETETGAEYTAVLWHFHE